MNKILLVTLCALVTGAIQPKTVSAATASQTVTVDFGQVLGPVTQRAAGTFPADITQMPDYDNTFNTLWMPQKFQLFTWQRPSKNKDGIYSFPSLTYAIKLNAYYQTKIYHNPGDMTLGVNSPWGQEVAAIARAAQATGYPKIQLDILNEQDWSGYWPFTGNINDPAILTAWRIAYDAAKAVSPNIQLVGPNTGAGSISWLKGTFLPTMKTEGRLPDILSWHEINTDINSIGSRVLDMRSFLAQNGMTAVKDISINEYNYNTDYLLPGRAVKFISQLEKGKVQSASRACWVESSGSYNCGPQLNGMLDTNKNPRAVYWTYKWYADLTGNMVATADPAAFSAVAAKDAAAGKYSVVVGSNGGESSLAVKMANLENISYKFRVEKVGNTGLAAVNTPIFVKEYDATPVGGIHEIMITGVESEQAYSVTATKTATSTPVPSASTKPGDLDGDNDVDIYDYNKLVSVFGNPYTIYDYNTVVSNFGR